MIPFFASAAFGAAQKSSAVVIFKENSVYLVDYNQKASGNQSLQRLETRGLGAKYPFSIAFTRFGIAFANESGIYRLNRQLQVEYMGEKVERIWKRELELSDDVTLFHATHYSINNQYKLSAPLKDASEPTDVLVLDHNREEMGAKFGAWTRYDNHPSIGWANLDDEAYFASTKGKVYVLRKTLNKSDFRDDDVAISMDAVFRMWDLGDSALRKAVRSIGLHFRNVADMDGTTLITAIDGKNTFDEATAFSVDGNETTDALSDVNGDRISSIKFRIDRRKGQYIQARVQNSTIDEPVELTHIDFKAAPMKYRGTTEAPDTTR